MHTYRITPDRMETIQAVRQSTKWRPKHHTHITNDKYAAIAADRRDRTHHRIYTDGSGMDGKVGAAAVLFKGKRKTKSLRYLLGSDGKHTVYEGEGVGMLLGLELLRGI